MNSTKITPPPLHYTWIGPPPIPMPANKGQDTDGPIAMATAIKEQKLDNKVIFWCLDEYLEHYAATLKPHGIECRPIKTYLRRLAGDDDLWRSEEATLKSKFSQRQEGIAREGNSYPSLIASIASLTLFYIARSPVLTSQQIHEAFACFLLLNESGYILDTKASPIPGKQLNFQAHTQFKAARFRHTYDHMTHDGDVNVVYGPDHELGTQQKLPLALAHFENLSKVKDTQPPTLAWIEEKQPDGSVTRSLKIAASRGLLILFFENVATTTPQTYWETLSPSNDLDYVVVADCGVYHYLNPSTKGQENSLEIRRYLRLAEGILLSDIVVGDKVDFKFKQSGDDTKFVRLLLHQKVVGRTPQIIVQDGRSTISLTSEEFYSFLKVVRNYAKNDFHVSRKKEKDPQELLLIENIRTLLIQLMSERREYVFPDTAEKLLEQKLNALGLIMYGIQQGLPLLEAAREMEKGIYPNGPYEFFKEKSDFFDDSCEKILKDIYEKLAVTDNRQAQTCISKPSAPTRQQDEPVDEEGNTELHKAVKQAIQQCSRNLDPIRILVNKLHANFTQENNAGISPLHLVFEFDHDAILNIFLSSYKKEEFFNPHGYQIKWNCRAVLKQYYEKAQRSWLTKIHQVLKENIARIADRDDFSQILLQSFPSKIEPNKLRFTNRVTLVHPVIHLANPDGAALTAVLNHLTEQQKYHFFPSCFEFSIDPHSFKIKFYSELTEWSHGQQWHRMDYGDAMIDIVKGAFDKFQSVKIPSLQQVGLKERNQVDAVLEEFIPVKVLRKLIVDYSCNNDAGVMLEIPSKGRNEILQQFRNGTPTLSMPKGFNFYNNAITLMQAYLRSIQLPLELTEFHRVNEFPEVNQPVTPSHHFSNILAWSETANEEPGQKKINLKACKNLVLQCNNFLVIVPNPYYWSPELTLPTGPLTKERLGYPFKPAIYKRQFEDNMQNSRTQATQTPEKSQSTPEEKAQITASPQPIYTGNHGGGDISFEINANDEPSARNIWQVALSGTHKTRGEGDCAYHAILGKWNMASGQYECEDVAKPRKTVATAIRESKPGDDIYDLIAEAIKAIVMAERKIGSNIKKLIQEYQKARREDQENQSAAWNQLEAALKQNIKVMQQISTQANPNTLQAFQKCLQKDDFKNFIETEPEINRAFQAYNAATQTTFNWERLKEPGIINEYADFMERAGNDLLPIEIYIISRVMKITVPFYNRDAAVETLNLGKQKTNAVKFDGVNHFEHYVPPQDPQQNNAAPVPNEDPAYQEARKLLIQFKDNENVRKFLQQEICDAIAAGRFAMQNTYYQSLKDSYARESEKLQLLDAEKIELLQKMKVDLGMKDQPARRILRKVPDSIRKYPWSRKAATELENTIAKEAEARQSLLSINQSLWDYCLDPNVYLEFVSKYWRPSESDITSGSFKALMEILGIEILSWQPDKDNPNNLKLVHQFTPTKTRTVKDLFRMDDSSAGYRELNRKQPKVLAPALPKEQTQENKKALEDKIKAQFKPLPSDLQNGISRLYSTEPQLIDGGEYKPLKMHETKDGAYNDVELKQDGSNRRIGYVQDIGTGDEQQDAAGGVSVDINSTWPISGGTILGVSAKKAIETTRRTIYCEGSGATFLSASYCVAHDQEKDKRSLNCTFNIIGDSVPFVLLIKPAKRPEIETKNSPKFEVKVACLNSNRSHSTKNAAEILRIEKEFSAVLPAGQPVVSTNRYLYRNINGNFQEALGVTRAIGSNDVIGNNGEPDVFSEQIELEKDQIAIVVLASDFIYSSIHLANLETKLTEDAKEFFEASFANVQEIQQRENSLSLLTQHFVNCSHARDDEAHRLAQKGMVNNDKPPTHDNSSVIAGIATAAEPSYLVLTDGHGVQHGKEIAQRSVDAFLRYLLLFVQMEWVLRPHEDEHLSKDLFYAAILRGDKDTIIQILDHETTPQKKKDKILGRIPIGLDESEPTYYQLALGMALNSQLQTKPNEVKNAADATKHLEIFTLINNVLFPPNASYKKDNFAHPSCSQAVVVSASAEPPQQLSGKLPTAEMDMREHFNIAAEMVRLYQINCLDLFEAYLNQHEREDIFQYSTHVNRLIDSARGLLGEERSAGLATWLLTKGEEAQRNMHKEKSEEKSVNNTQKGAPSATPQLSANGVTLGEFKATPSATFTQPPSGESWITRSLDGRWMVPMPEDEENLRKALAESLKTAEELAEADPELAIALAESMKTLSAVKPAATTALAANNQPNQQGKNISASSTEKNIDEKAATAAVVSRQQAMNELISIVEQRNEAKFNQWMETHAKLEGDICTFRTEEGDTILHIAVQDQLSKAAVTFLAGSSKITDKDWEALKKSQNNALITPLVLAEALAGASVINILKQPRNLPTTATVPASSSKAKPDDDSVLHDDPVLDWDTTGDQNTDNWDDDDNSKKTAKNEKNKPIISSAPSTSSRSSQTSASNVSSRSSQSSRAKKMWRQSSLEEDSTSESNASWSRSSQSSGVNMWSQSSQSSQDSTSGSNASWSRSSQSSGAEMLSQSSQGSTSESNAPRSKSSQDSTLGAKNLFTPPASRATKGNNKGELPKPGRKFN